MSQLDQWNEAVDRLKLELGRALLRAARIVEQAIEALHAAWHSVVHHIAFALDTLAAKLDERYGEGPADLARRGRPWMAPGIDRVLYEKPDGFEPTGEFRFAGSAVGVTDGERAHVPNVGTFDLADPRHPSLWRGNPDGTWTEADLIDRYDAWDEASMRRLTAAVFDVSEEDAQRILDGEPADLVRLAREAERRHAEREDAEAANEARLEDDRIERDRGLTDGD